MKKKYNVFNEQFSCFPSVLKTTALVLEISYMRIYCD